MVAISEKCQKFLANSTTGKTGSYVIKTSFPFRHPTSGSWYSPQFCGIGYEHIGLPLTNVTVILPANIGQVLNCGYLLDTVYSAT